MLFWNVKALGAASAIKDGCAFLETNLCFSILIEGRVGLQEVRRVPKATRLETG